MILLHLEQIGQEARYLIGNQEPGEKKEWYENDPGALQTNANVSPDEGNLNEYEELEGKYQGPDSRCVSGQFPVGRRQRGKRGLTETGRQNRARQLSIDTHDTRGHEGCTSGRLENYSPRAGFQGRRSWIPGIAQAENFERALALTRDDTELVSRYEFLKASERSAISSSTAKNNADACLAWQNSVAAVTGASLERAGTRALNDNLVNPNRRDVDESNGRPIGEQNLLKIALTHGCRSIAELHPEGIGQLLLRGSVLQIAEKENVDDKTQDQHAEYGKRVAGNEFSTRQNNGGPFG